MQTQHEFLQLIDKAADAHEPLRDLQQNPSRVSAWRYAKEVMAFAMYSLSRMFAKHKADIAAQIAKQEVGTPQWYIDRIREFQYGDRLYLVNNIPSYAETAPEKQIVQHASMTETAQGVVQAKVVRKDTSGNLIALSAEQKNALTGYIRQIKFAGTRIEIISAEADAIKLTIIVERDAQIIDSQGKNLLNPNIEPVKVAITQYFQRLPFDSVLYLSRLQDAIQAVSGVRDVEIQSAAFKNPQQPTYRSILRKYTTYAGHLRLDEGSTITYI